VARLSCVDFGAGLLDVLVGVARSSVFVFVFAGGLGGCGRGTARGGLLVALVVFVGRPGS
jgi:hypothetical protein